MLILTFLSSVTSGIRILPPLVHYWVPTIQVYSKSSFRLRPRAMTMAISLPRPHEGSVFSRLTHLVPVWQRAPWNVIKDVSCYSHFCHCFLRAVLLFHTDPRHGEGLVTITRCNENVLVHCLANLSHGTFYLAESLNYCFITGIDCQLCV